MSLTPLKEIGDGRSYQNYIIITNINITKHRQCL